MFFLRCATNPCRKHYEHNQSMQACKNERKRYSYTEVPKSVSKAEFLDEIQPKVLRVFFLAMHSHLCSFALRFLFLETHTTSDSFYCSVTVLLYTVKEKGGKPDRKPYPLLYGLRNPYSNLISGNSQDYAQNP